jgi:hypothetical protein
VNVFGAVFVSVFGVQTAQRSTIPTPTTRLVTIALILALSSIIDDWLMIKAWEKRLKQTLTQKIGAAAPG